MRPGIGGRKGYFLLLDSIFAIIILVIGYIMVSSYQADRPAEAQLTETSKDMINLLAGTKVSEICTAACVCDPVAPGTALAALCAAGDIHNAGNTLMEEIGELVSEGYDAAASGILSEMKDTGLLYRDRLYGLQISVDDGATVHTLFGSGTEAQAQQKKSRKIISVKKIVFGSWRNEDTGTFTRWGPYVVEVRVWQI